MKFKINSTLNSSKLIMSESTTSTITTTTSTTSTSSELSENIPAEMKIKLSESLIKSIQSQELTSIEEFLNLGADINYLNGLPLITAIDNDNTDIIDLLLKKGAKTNSLPLFSYAVLHGKINSVKKFIELNFNPYHPNSEVPISVIALTSIPHNYYRLENPEVSNRLQIAWLMGEYYLKIMKSKKKEYSFTFGESPTKKRKTF